MSDPFEIKITTPADLTGGEKTVQTLDTITTKSEEASSALDKVGESTKNIGEGNSVDTVKELGTELEKAAGKVKELSSNSDELGSSAGLTEAVTVVKELVAQIEAAVGKAAELKNGSGEEEGSGTAADAAQALGELAQAHKEVAAGEEEQTTAGHDLMLVGQELVALFQQLKSSGADSGTVVETVGGSLQRLVPSFSRLLPLLGETAALAGPAGIAIGAMAVSLYLAAQRDAELEAANDKLANSFQTSKERTDELVSALKELNAANLNEALENAKKLTEEYARATDQLREQRRLQDQQSDTKLAADVAKNELERQKALSEAGPDRDKREAINLDYNGRELGVRQEYEKRKAAQELARANEDVTGNSQAQENVRKAMDTVNTPVATAQRNLDDANQRRQDLGVKSDQQLQREELEDLEKKFKAGQLDAGSFQGKLDIARMRGLGALSRSGDLKEDKTFVQTDARLKNDQSEAADQFKEAYKNGDVLNPFDQSKLEAARKHLQEVNEAIALLAEKPEQEKAVATASEAAAKQIDVLATKLKELEAQAGIAGQKVEILKTQNEALTVKQEGQALSQSTAVNNQQAEAKEKAIKAEAEASKKVADQKQQEEARVLQLEIDKKKDLQQDSSEEQKKLIDVKLPRDATPGQLARAEWEKSQIGSKVPQPDLQPITLDRREYNDGAKGSDSTSLVNRDNSKITQAEHELNGALQQAQKGGLDGGEIERILTIAKNTMDLIKTVGGKANSSVDKIQKLEQDLEQLRSQVHASAQ